MLSVEEAVGREGSWVVREENLERKWKFVSLFETGRM